MSSNSFNLDNYRKALINRCLLLPHFTDEETGTEGLSDSPKTTWLLSGFGEKSDPNVLRHPFI